MRTNLIRITCSCVVLSAGAAFAHSTPRCDGDENSEHLASVNHLVILVVILCCGLRCSCLQLNT
jgi:hypothetical protein